MPSTSRSGKWVPASGWPLRYTALQHYYEEAQAFFGFGPFGYDADDWAQTLGASGSGVLPLARERFRTKVFQLSPHTKFGAAWRAAFDKAANPVVYLHANAIDIEATADAGLITGVSVATLSGVRLRLVSRMFVLAAGGLENARFLLASRGAQPTGLGNHHDQVGRHFTEHIEMSSGVILVSDAAMWSAYLGASLPVFGHPPTLFHNSNGDVSMSDVSSVSPRIELAAADSADSALKRSGWRGRLALASLFVLASSGYGLMFLAVDTLKGAP